MSHSWVRSHLAQKGHSGSQILHKSRTGYSLSNKVQNFNRIFYVEFNPKNSLPAYLKASLGSLFSCACACAINESRFVPPIRNFGSLLAKGQLPQSFSSVARNDTSELESGLGDDVMCCNLELSDLDSGDACIAKKEKVVHEKMYEYLKIDINLLPTVILVGRPNVGKSALLNRLIRRREALVYNTPDDHVTRDIREGIAKLGDLRFRVLDSAGLETEMTSGSILQRTASITANVLARTQFAVLLIDARTGKEKGPSSLSIMQSRKNLMRVHVVALVLDAEEIAKARRSMTHAEVVIARQAVEEGRGLVVIVNKMDLLRGRQNSQLFEKVMEAVPLEIQMVIPQVCGIPVVFISALEGRGRIAVLRQVISTYEKWCLRLPTAKLNRWMRKVMSRHSWKAAQPKIKYFTQVKARPPTFVAFTSGKTILSDTELRFLTKSLKEDFDLGGIPIRILQRSVPRNIASSGSKSNHYQTVSRMAERVLSGKRTVAS